MGDAIKNLRWNVRQRFEYIEYLLCWEGSVNRGDLKGKFDISVPQASSDLALYQQEAAENMEYDASLKAYVPTEAFKPKFYEPSARDYLTELRLIADGVTTIQESWSSWLPPFAVVPLVRRKASVPRLQKVLQAIRLKRALYIHYHSLKRPDPIRRWISPHALVFDGYRWHTRAWCHLRKEYRDFMLARMMGVEREKDFDFDPQKDGEWQEEVVLKIGPNPKLEEPIRETIAFDFGMRDGVLELPTRIALFWYVEKHLGLDLDQYKGVPAERQQIVLLNRKEVNAAQKRAKAIQFT